MKSKDSKKNKKNRAGSVILFLILLMGLMVYLLPQFYVKQIQVSGTRILDIDEVIETGGLENKVHLLKGIKGDSLKDYLSLRHRDAEKVLLEKFPYIKEVKIRSVFPSVLLVDLVERVEVAYIAVGDSVLIIDADTVALELYDKGLPSDIPVIEGLIVDYIDLGSPVSVDMPEYLNQTAFLLTRMINADRDEESQTRLLASTNFLRPVGSGIIYMTVNLPSDSELKIKLKINDYLDEHLSWLRIAVESGKLEDKEGMILDLTGKQRYLKPDTQK